MVNGPSNSARPRLRRPRRRRPATPRKSQTPPSSSLDGRGNNAHALRLTGLRSSGDVRSDPQPLATSNNPISFREINQYSCLTLYHDPEAQEAGCRIPGGQVGGEFITPSNQKRLPTRLIFSLTDNIRFELGGQATCSQ